MSWGALLDTAATGAVNTPGTGARRTRTSAVPMVSGIGSSCAAADAGPVYALTIDAAIEEIPGVTEQRTTFNQILGVTFVIAVVVVALFFALITVERTSLYGVLKAIGARSSTLFGGLVTQALVVTGVASAIGVTLGLVLDVTIPAGALPFDLTPARILLSISLLIVAAVVGCAFSLRRVLRVDPAAAIGGAT